jgi:hypothetical protein
MRGRRKGLRRDDEVRVGEEVWSIVFAAISYRLAHSTKDGDTHAIDYDVCR